MKLRPFDRPVILTNCTARKRFPPAVSFEQGTFATVSEASERWWTAASNATPVARAVDLYQGRAFQLVKTAAHAIGAEVLIVSAGLGLVGANERVPSYDLTVSGEAGPVSQLLRETQLPTSAWWEAIGEQRGTAHPISRLILGAQSEFVYLALTAPYLCLIQSDLTRVRRFAADRVRIFTSRPGVKAIPESLVRNVMPYDVRLEGTRLAGTQSDFPQRALSHFLLDLKLHGSSLEKSRESVESALTAISVRPKLQRRRATDDEIVAMIRAYCATEKRGPSSVLRYLRDELRISCEQSRCAALCSRAKQESYPPLREL